MRCLNAKLPDTANKVIVKYVALLAFNRIVASHPHIVSMQQDVIMSCIDDPDISIRLQALDLGAGMVNSDNLVSVVERLLQQLRSAPMANSTTNDSRTDVLGLEAAADSDGEDPEETLRPTAESLGDNPALPAEYRMAIIHQILGMCSKDTYANIIDFEWYIDTLIQLVELVPAIGRSTSGLSDNKVGDTLNSSEHEAAGAIGWELRNIAVRVSTVRTEAVKAAKSLMVVAGNEVSSAFAGVGAEGVLQFAAWIVGEYLDNSALSYDSMDSLIHPKARLLPPTAICAYLQAIPKVFSAIVSCELPDWSSERKAMMSLLVARITHFLEPLTTHPNLEVQERSVELLELMRIASQAITSHGLENRDGPTFIIGVIPQLFSGSKLNPVAPTAQCKVPIPTDLDLEAPINQDLPRILQHADQDFGFKEEAAEFESFYHRRSIQKATNGSTFDTLASFEPQILSYQQKEEDSDALMRKRDERRGRNKDDPFYIGNGDGSSGTSTPFHDILRSTNDEDVDVDSIPIMNLDLGDKTMTAESFNIETKKKKRTGPKKFQIARDENIEQEDPSISGPRSKFSDVNGDCDPFPRVRDTTKKSLLEVDSSGLGSFSLSSTESTATQLHNETQEVQDAEMAKALAEVERLRLEMQRASERIQAADGTPAEGTLVKKKKRKKKLQQSTGNVADQNKHTCDGGLSRDTGAEAVPVTRRKKKKKPAVSEPDNEKAVADSLNK